MADGISINIDTRGLQRLIRLGSNLGPTLRRGVNRVLIEATNQAKRNIAKRSGQLARSYQPRAGRDTEYSLTNTATSARGRVASKKVYARIQELGGTVRPRSKKWLTIPLKPALTASGVPKRPSARDWPELVFIPRDAATAILARVEGNKVTPFYALKKKVRLKGSGDVDKAVRSVRPKADDIIDAAIQETLNKR